LPVPVNELKGWHFSLLGPNVKRVADEGFDQIFDRLKAVVDKLEQGNLTLEEALRAFEEGVSLARRGHALLEAADRRTEMPVRGPEVEPLVPFAPGAADR